MKGQTMQIILSSNSKLQDLYLDKDIIVSGEIDFESKEYKAGNGLILSNDTFSVNSNKVINRVDSNCEAFSDKSIAIGTNNKVYTDFSYVFGANNVVGSRAFTIISGDSSRKIWKLKSTDGISVGDEYSYQLMNCYNKIGKVVAIDQAGNTISVEQEFWPTRIDELLSDPALSAYEWYDPDSTLISAHGTLLLGSNTLNIEKKPHLGDVSSFYAYSTAFGRNAAAINDCAFAEGRNTTAAGKYSHAEGNGTYAGYASHAEGEDTQALGVRSHAEGLNTVSRGMGSHSEGYNTVADSGHTGYGPAHAEGYQTSALAPYSHAAGIYSNAAHQNAWVWNGDQRNRNYSSTRIGEFRINPVNGISGFYVGDSDLNSIIENKISDRLGVIESIIDEILQ